MAELETNNERRERRHMSSGHVWTGVFLLIIGVVAFLKTMLFPIPEWVFTWQTLLLAIGLFIGIRHRFHGVAWLILMLFGVVFLLNDYYPDISIKKYIWPLALILVGIFFIFRSRHRRWDWRKHMSEGNKEEGAFLHYDKHSSEDFIDSTSIFGGVKKNVLSKKFMGGDVMNIFGGTEINLSQADINGKVIMEVTQMFGGTKLILPSNWEVKSEIVALFAGVEDKRQVQNVTVDPEKILILRGTSIFGGIEIKSF